MSTDLHKPVLIKEFLEAIEPLGSLSSYLDCTFGRGGHALEVARAYHSVQIHAIDRDLQAIDYGKTFFSQQSPKTKITFYRQNFMSEQLPVDGVDLILADLGVSSPQYDQPERGFSFYHDGPLDMRMDQGSDFKASDIINSWSEDELIGLFRNLGEHRNPVRVVRAIVNDRDTTPFTTTRQLSGLIERVDGWRKKGSHPATKYFMALRLSVNEEIEPLSACLEKLILALRPGGRLCVVTFHSIEDRIVKHRFRDLKDLGTIITKKVIKVSKEEVEENPRSRTSKLRVFERGVDEA